MILKMMTLTLETKEKPYFVIKCRTNGQFKFKMSNANKRSIQRMDALAKSLSKKAGRGTSL